MSGGGRVCELCGGEGGSMGVVCGGRVCELCGREGGVWELCVGGVWELCESVGV